MRATLIIGWKTPNEPIGIYCGVDGVAAEEAAAKACKSGKFMRIGKLVNPSVTPMPCVPEAAAKPAKQQQQQSPPASGDESKAETKTDESKS